MDKIHVQRRSDEESSVFNGSLGEFALRLQHDRLTHTVSFNFFHEQMLWIAFLMNLNACSPEYVRESTLTDGILFIVLWQWGIYCRKTCALWRGRLSGVPDRSAVNHTVLHRHSLLVLPGLLPLTAIDLSSLISVIILQKVSSPQAVIVTDFN